MPTAAELEHHFLAVAQATSLPIMLYNNPPAYRVHAVTGSWCLPVWMTSRSRDFAWVPKVGFRVSQTIKLAEEIMGRGSERVRPPRLTLTGECRAAVTAMVNKAAATISSLGALER